jgi:hypothetical protein
MTTTSTPTTNQSSILESRVAPFMFALGFTYLLIAAGMIHRASDQTVNELELQLMYGGLALAWPFFAVEGFFALIRRSPEVRLRKAFWRVILVLVFPPARLGWIHPTTNKIWLPRLGWVAPGKPLLKALDKWFGVPMLLFAFLILQVLGLEYAQVIQAKANPVFGLVLDLGVAIIWVAFATEFIIKASAAPSSLRYAKERWLDAAIVLLPTLEFMLTRWVDAAPLARLLRMGRAVSPDQIARMGKIYRLRGLMMKGWHAFLLLEGVGRLLGHTPEKRLQQIETQIASLEEQITDLQKEADEVRKKLTEREEAARKPLSSQEIR